METFLKFSIDLEDGSFWHSKKHEDYKISVGIDAVDGTYDGVKKFEAKRVCDLQQGDKLFFATGVTIPRVKLKNIYNEFGAKSVRDIDQADKVIIGHKTDDALCDYSWSYKVTTEGFKNFMEALEPDVNIDTYYLQKVTDALEFYQNEYVVIDSYSSARLLTDDAVPNPLSNEDCKGSNPFYYIKADRVEEYKSYQGKDIYHEDSLLKYINGTDAVTIDETMYNTLCGMFNSGDTDNTVLAMEIMANSNYFESLVYILMLFEEYGSRISDQRSRNHVNFKGLCSYLGISPNYISKDDVVSGLLQKDAVTIENMSVVIKKYHNEVSGRGDSTYFKVQAVTFNDKISQILEKQLVKRVEVFTLIKKEEDAIEPQHSELGSNPVL
jgi:hypothetical protein